jgi:two-component system NtrC family sensor kinase
MKLLLSVVILLLGLSPTARAQRSSAAADSLQRLLAQSRADTTRVLLLAQLAHEYTQTYPLATLRYGQQSLRLAQQLGFHRGECLALIRLGSGLREAGNYPAALQIGLQALRLAQTMPDLPLRGRANNALGYLNWEQGNSRPALRYFLRAKALAAQAGDSALLTRVMGNIGNAYQQLGMLDSALYYLHQGYTLDLRRHDLTSEVGDAAMLGNVYTALNQPQLARRYYRASIRRAEKPGIIFALCRAYLGLARLYQKEGGAQVDSALYFGRQALAAGQQRPYPKGVLEASLLLSAAYAARRDSSTAFRYLTLAAANRDSLFSQAKIAQVQALAFGELLHQQERAEQEAQVAAQHRQNWLLAALAAALPIVLLLWRNNRLKQRANQQLNKQNEQIARQRDELSNALGQVRTTQAQLVQREKMAFLGELTAGIAHELQNPLAFVRNFADVSTLLVDDMSDAEGRPQADRSQQLLLAGLKQNLREISQHGQRATSIIADMLAHSRSGSAAHTPTNVNALVAEYLPLAYQALRAKDKTFTATITTHFAPDLPLVPAVGPDLGRALLNLFTNAFYAVQQRQKQNPTSYTAEVIVSTSLRPDGQVEIRVHDNGLGMPPSVQAQVFQPFFTTKPSDEGTGLGLSLSHDIVVKNHGGSLSVESQESAYTEFIIVLPTQASAQ